MEQAKTSKRSSRSGKRIGLKGRAKVSIAVNDEDRNISRLWEILKRYDSKKKITAAETARRVFLRGLVAEVEDMTLSIEKLKKEEVDKLQGLLF